MADRAPEIGPDVLYYEPGSRWWAIAFGPIFCLIALVIELFTGPVVHWFGLAMFAVILTGLVYVQVIAARRHASVLLTATTLRQGTEEVPITEIAEVFPESDDAAYEDEMEPWETARALGELSGVPRRRHGIGLRLTTGGLVRAWAKDDQALREALSQVVVVGVEPDGSADD
ncbi:hypothetical protein ACH49M_19580 [Rhodococcus qingshengii]|uniref:DUF3093 domain-containing protein n=2 Tax=Rhodococcus qingshengii TaxID=334542 RepID=A0AAW6LIS5_RHOSG|nr:MULTISPECIES: hypothetical protein [Rhodococcus]EEN88143.1 hypothetical protein RHOER0001_6117 [Rhodococcus erythropolis SK121]NHE68325.1 hypothetical protein [Rhodococcus sp. D-46]OCC18811.1 hypothetical protein AS590_04910 [Prescottella equi]ALU72225.1 membrane protein [Rhodococcus erythropolis R138]ANQ72664.1 hypothetical protein AOT96_18710 [Rhodococcus sp. 008]